MRRVVITGMGLVSSIGICLDTFWENLLRKGAKIHHGARFNPHPYRSDRCTVVDYEAIWPQLNISEEENERLNDCSAIGLSAAREAIDDAGLTNYADLKKGGFSMATTSGGEIDQYSKWYHYGHPRSDNVLDHCHIFMPAVHIAEKLGLQGPVCTFSSACTSGTVSLAYAYETIKYSDTDLMIAGGSDVLEELPFAGFNSLRIVSKKDCRPFDARRTGIIIGDGAAFIVLEERAAALKRGAAIYAEIKGVGMSCDAHHATLPIPDGPANAMRAALKEANIKPCDIQYINCHGTGSIANDRAEAQAMFNVFNKALMYIYASSTKSSLGHLLGTAGSIEAVITTLAIRKGQIPPMHNLNEIDPIVQFRVPKNEPVQLDLKMAMSNSFGFGGNNISMIFTCHRA